MGKASTLDFTDKVFIEIIKPKEDLNLFIYYRLRLFYNYLYLVRVY